MLRLRRGVHLSYFWNIFDYSLDRDIAPKNCFVWSPCEIIYPVFLKYLPHLSKLFTASSSNILNYPYHNTLVMNLKGTQVFLLLFSWVIERKLKLRKTAVPTFRITVRTYNSKHSVTNTSPFKLVYLKTIDKNQLQQKPQQQKKKKAEN